MTEPFQFLIAATVYHPAAPYLAVVLSLGLFSVAFIAFGTPVRQIESENRPKYRTKRGDAVQSPSVAVLTSQLARAKIDCVPVLDPARAELLERLEDVVECLGRAQRVLPDIALSRVLRIHHTPEEAAMAETTHRALSDFSLDFGVFSYGGHLELALMVGPQAGTEADPGQQLIETALARAGVPFIRIPPDALSGILRSRIRSALCPAPDRARAA